MFFLLDIEDGSGNEDDKKTWYDFVVEKEQLFIRNIYSKEEHADMENISHIADYHREFGRFVKIVMLLKKHLDNPRAGEDSLLEEFFQYDLNDEFRHLGEIRDAIDKFKVVRKFGKCDYIDKTISFVYTNIMNLKNSEKGKTLIFSGTFIDNFKGLMYSKTNIHHSHITGEIIGYSYSYCNLKVRQNKDKVRMIAHNLFRFNVFFFLKGIRASSWRTREVAGTSQRNI